MAKKLLVSAIIITIFLCFVLSGCTKETPEDNTAGFSFALQGEEYAVIGYQGKTEITIPSSYNGKSVTSIAESAFYDSNVSRVIISEGIKTIGSNAFADARGLYYIYIPSSVTTIGENIFSECSALNEIEVSEQNSRFSSFEGNLYDKDKKKLLAFSMGGGARDFSLIEGVEEIKDYVFYQCKSINKLTLPSTLKTIGELAFVGSSISSFEVAQGNTVFSSNDGILYCDNGDTLYAYPSSKSGDTFETSAKKIYEYAFAYTMIKTLTLAEGVKEIGNGGFVNSLIEEIIIPSTVTAIGANPFQDCLSLAEISVSPTNTKYQDIDGNLYNKQGTIFYAYAAAKENSFFALAEGIIEVAEYAFYNAQKLEEIELPASLEKIGEEAFGSFSITTVVLNSALPPDIEESSFMQISGVRLFVPDNKGQLYKDAWQTYENIIKEFHER